MTAPLEPAVPAEPAVSPEQAQLARVLRALRESRLWTQDDLAEATGMTRSYISRVECMQTDPRVEEVRAWARACGTSIGSLFGLTTWRTEEVIRLALALEYPLDEDPNADGLVAAARDALYARQAILGALKAAGLKAGPRTWDAELEAVVTAERRKAVEEEQAKVFSAAPERNEWKDVLLGGLKELGAGDEVGTLAPREALLALAGMHRANIMAARVVDFSGQKVLVEYAPPAGHAVDRDAQDRSWAIVSRCLSALAGNLQNPEDAALLALVDVIQMELGPRRGVGRG